MNNTDFFSSSFYLVLPTKNNPKVALCVDNKNIAKKSFKLYNPFSKKAQILKKIALFCFVYCNTISRFLFASKQKKSAIVVYLEKLLDEKLKVSLYFATAGDKIVLQLQTTDAKIIGYVKYPINKTGIDRILNEIKAFDILSDKKIVKPYMLFEKYDSKPVLLLAELDGKIGILSRDTVLEILEKFKRNQKYTLENHPRILALQHSLKKLKMLTELNRVNEICIQSSRKYDLVYEHGDFAPWNITKVKERYIPFDFEYFVEDGLEYFDLIKYYYQIGSLLESKKNDEIKKYIFDKIKFDEIEYIYDLFIIKEKIISRLELV